jgi:hypothetical protein
VSGRKGEIVKLVVGLIRDTVRRSMSTSAGLTAQQSDDAAYEGVLASLGYSAAEAQNALVVARPPSDPDELSEWYSGMLRVQHAHITDALSGRRLNAITECVAIQMKGVDPAGKPLDVKDVEGLSAWLRGLQNSAPGPLRCALLTAGPAAGKTWMMSQLVVHSLGCTLVPILVKAERLQKQMLESRAAFAESSNWLDVSIRLEHGATSPLYRMLRDAIEARRALLLIDGLDEAGVERAPIEQHIAKRLALQGHVLLATSRPAGLAEELFTDFYRLDLAPLSDKQQTAFIERHCDKRVCLSVTASYFVVLQVVNKKELLGHVFWVGHQNCALV